MKLKKFQEKELTIIEYEDIIEIGKVFKGGQRIRKKSGNEINTILEKLEKQGYKLEKKDKNKFGDIYYYLKKIT